MINKLFLKHFKYKVLTNFIRIPITFLLQSIIPRLLGPVAYGNYEFLHDLSIRVLSFLESGVSMGFVTKFNENINSRKIIKYYSILFLVISIFYFTVVFFLIKIDYSKYIWIDQELYWILLSVILGILVHLSSNILRLIDAYGLTVQGEKMRVIQLLISLLFTIIVYFTFSKISLVQFYYLQFIVFITLILGAGIVLRKTNFFNSLKLKLRKVDYSFFNRYFLKYSYPMFGYSIVALIIGFSERWMLQNFGGSVQTGIFAISFKIGALIFIFTSAAIDLLTREFSKSFGKKKILEIKTLFNQNFKILYLLATYISICVMFHTELIIKLIGGEDYKEAGIVLQILCIYPIHQTIGQLNSTVFYSTNRTLQYRNIGVICMICLFPLSFFLLASEDYSGLDLGAIGLITYMIIVQLVTSNINLYYNCRFLKSNFLKLFYFQIKILLIGFLFSYFTNIIISNIIVNDNFLSLILKGFISSITITIFVMFCVYISPNTFGLKNFKKII